MFSMNGFTALETLWASWNTPDTRSFPYKDRGLEDWKNTFVWVFHEDMKQNWENRFSLRFS